jgi:hypothetical protein
MRTLISSGGGNHGKGMDRGVGVHDAIGLKAGLNHGGEKGCIPGDGKVGGLRW